MSEQQPFKWRHFEAEIILVCVRWYLRYALSYRDLEELMITPERTSNIEQMHTSFLDLL
jgi:transposase-like protein